MSRWFRSYADTHRNPKVAKLSDRHFRLWHNLMCVAAENDGIIPALSDLKHVLNARLDHLSTGVEALISGGLIDRLEDGYAPHNWDKRQYKSDTSTERVQKFRGKRNVSETPPDTDTDTDTEITPNGVMPRKRAAPKKLLAPDWIPSTFGRGTRCDEIILGWERGKFFNELERFHAHHRSRATMMVDWQAAWQTWVLNSDKFDKQGGNNDRGRNQSRNAGAAERAFGPASTWTDERTF